LIRAFKSEQKQKLAFVFRKRMKAPEQSEAIFDLIGAKGLSEANSRFVSPSFKVRIKAPLTTAIFDLIGAKGLSEANSPLDSSSSLTRMFLPLSFQTQLSNSISTSPLSP
jgi:hypothetical protein